MMNIRKRYLIAAVIMFIAAAGLLLLNIYYSGSNVVVFMYHTVREEPVNPEADVLSVRPSEFEKHLQFFKEKNMKSITASELKGNLSKHRKYVVITLDDGYEDNYTEVFPLLKKYNMKATVFMITSLIDVEGYLTSEQIREMTDSGLVSVQSHTVYHRPLAWGDKTREEIDFELAQSKAVLENISGKRVDCISMPNGNYDGVVIDMSKEYYDVIFTDAGYQPYSGDITDVHRVGIYRNHSLSDLKAITDRRGLYVIKRGIEKLLHIDL